jgi:tetratricopeptide (TPR) repeat protein
MGGNEFRGWLLRIGVTQADIAAALASGKSPRSPSWVNRALDAEPPPDKREAWFELAGIIEKLANKHHDRGPFPPGLDGVLRTLFKTDSEVYTEVCPCDVLDPKPPLLSIENDRKDGVRLARRLAPGALVVTCRTREPFGTVGLMLGLLCETLQLEPRDRDKLEWGLNLPFFREALGLDRWFSQNVTDLIPLCRKLLGEWLKKRSVILERFDDPDEESVEVLQKLQLGKEARLIVVGKKVDALGLPSVRARDFLDPPKPLFTIPRLFELAFQGKRPQYSHEEMDLLVRLYVHGGQNPMARPVRPAAVLDDQQRRVLTCFGIFDGPVRRDFIEQVLGGTQALEWCIEVGLVEESASYLRCPHDVLQKRDILPQDLAELQTRVAELLRPALQKSEKPELPVRLASESHHHALLAHLYKELGRPSEAAQAHAAAIRCARDNSNFVELRHRVDKAQKDLELSSAAGMKAIGIEAASHLMKEVAERRVASLQFAEVDQVLSAFSEAFEDGGSSDPLERASACKTEAYVQNHRGPAGKAIPMLEKALQYLAKSLAEPARFEPLHAFWSQERKESKKRRKSGKQRTKAEKKEDLAAVVESCIQLFGNGRALGELVSIFKETGLVYSKCGRLRDATAVIEVALGVTQHEKFEPRWRGWGPKPKQRAIAALQVQLGWVLWRRGRHPEATAVLNEARVAARTHNDVRVEAWALVALMHVLIERGPAELEQMRKWLHPKTAVGGETEDKVVLFNRFYLEGCLSLRTLVAKLLDEEENVIALLFRGPPNRDVEDLVNQTEKLLDEAARVFPPGVFEFEPLYAEYRLLELWLFAGKMEGLIARAQALIADCIRLRARREQGIAQRILGVALARAGRREVAEAAFTSAIEILEKHVGDRLECARARVYFALMPRRRTPIDRDELIEDQARLVRADQQLEVLLVQTPEFLALQRPPPASPRKPKRRK